MVGKNRRILMETRRKLRKVGGSVMLPIPPEMLRDMSLGVGHDVVLSSEDGGIHVRPSVPRPSADAVEFMAEFMEEYDDAMRNLAER
jgi:antitoxin component of MazEF toxin-antitoxin module